MTFTQKLKEIQTRQGSLLCIGLDVDPEKIPVHLKSLENPVLEFNRQIIEATKDLVCAYKPNLAFYEAMGTEGFQTLKETLKMIPSSVITIGDGKRGDIGNTAKQYARSLFHDFGFDSVTVNPYMGFDSVEPFIENPQNGVFLLALTSNSGSKDFQRLKVNGKPLYEKVVRSAKKWNKYDNLGLVVGATHPRELKLIRKIVPDMPLLIPGIGKQGGDLKSVVRYGCDKNGQLAVINISRSVIYASQEKDFADAARKEAEKIVKEIKLYNK
ncbi:MAG: orotidine-5'-phosphate decarboxylase [Bacteroidetes bacterium]|nr:orotidine-5'-phosphate decarboxylase [Bacteroidota bacterium]